MNRHYAVDPTPVKQGVNRNRDADFIERKRAEIEADLRPFVHVSEITVDVREFVRRLRRRSARARANGLEVPEHRVLRPLRSATAIRRRQYPRGADLAVWMERSDRRTRAGLSDLTRTVRH